jgi:hypothetical protein
VAETVFYAAGRDDRNVRHFFSLRSSSACARSGTISYEPRNRLREARRIVKPYCEEKGISYRETSLIESYAQVSRNFTEMARITPEG